VRLLGRVCLSRGRLVAPHVESRAGSEEVSRDDGPRGRGRSSGSRRLESTVAIIAQAFLPAGRAVLCRAACARSWAARPRCA